ncbi:MAG TPA: DbpA RNA binding domain-containing protein [Spirochaetia bacterium]|nr:DbpA RNA binding domain-containing protein [Spirochaetia bacterium]
MLSVLKKGKDAVVETIPGLDKAESITALAVARIERRRPGIQSLIITSQADDVRNLSHLLRAALQRIKSPVEVIEAGTADTARKEAGEISRQPDIVVATNDRVIDHLRRGQLDLSGISLVIVDEPDESRASGFNVDIQFIVSKLASRPQIVVYTPEIHSGIAILSPLLRRPVYLPHSSWSRADESTQRSHAFRARSIDTGLEEAPVNGQAPDRATDTARAASAAISLQEQIQEIVRRIHEEENPDELNIVRRAIRKGVPFFTRGYFAAYLLKYLKDSPSVRAPRQERARNGFTSLFVGIGKNRRVFPRDLIQLFAGLEGITADDIGEIKILDNYSFVEVEPGKAAQVIGLLNGKDFRGRKLNVNYARKKD